MNKTEMLRRSAMARNEQQSELLSGQSEVSQSVNPTAGQVAETATDQTIEKLAQTVEPLAQAMASLTDDTNKTLAQLARTLAAIEQKTRQSSEQFEQRLSSATQALQDATAQAQKEALRLSQISRRIGINHYVDAIVTGISLGLIVVLLSIAFWIWRAPSLISVQMDPKAVAEQLKAAGVPLRPSKGK